MTLEGEGADRARRAPLQRIIGWLHGRSGELRLALRTTLAGLVTFALAQLFDLRQGYWAVFTSVLVIQASVGGSLKAGLDRMVSTVAGAIWGVSITLALPHRDVLTLGVALAVAIAPLAVVAALKPSYRVAPVTAVIVLLSTTTTGVPLAPLQYGMDRVLEIGLGCVVGFAVSLLVLPARAHGLLAEAAAEVLLALRELLDLLLGDLTRSPEGASLAAAYLRLGHSLTRVEGQVDEVKRERANRLTELPDAEPVARTLRRLRTDVGAIGRTVTAPLPPAAVDHLADAIRDLRLVASDYLSASAVSVRMRSAPPSPEPLDKATLTFRDSMDRLRELGALRRLDLDDVERVFSLAFAINQLRADLADLGDRIAEHAKPSTTNPA